MEFGDSRVESPVPQTQRRGYHQRKDIENPNWI
jgi:hypothetical protein